MVTSQLQATHCGWQGCHEKSNAPCAGSDVEHVGGWPCAECDGREMKIIKKGNDGAILAHKP
jgi:hypothetical protein